MLTAFEYAHADAAFGDQEQRVTAILRGAQPVLSVDAGLLVAFEEHRPGECLFQSRQQGNLGPPQVDRAEAPFRIEQAGVANTDGQDAAQLRWVQISCDFADSLNDLFGREWLAEFKTLFPTAPHVPEQVRKSETQAVAFQVERHKVARLSVERKRLTPAASARITIPRFIKNAFFQEIAKCVTHAGRV